MKRLAAICEQVAATTKKLEKTATVAAYFSSSPVEEAAVSAIFLSGRAFPLWEETTLQVGGSLLWRVVGELSGKSQDELTASYKRHGDLGSVAAEVLPDIRRDADLSVLEVQKRFREIATASGVSAKAALLRDLLSHTSPLEAKYVAKIMTADLRIGLKESLVEEAIAKAYGPTVSEVQRANMLLGDIGETLRLAAGGKLSEARMRLFHPLGFMLASPADSAEAALTYFENAFVEDKYDGIRAQVHCSGDNVKIFSRTRDEITESFPELADALSGFAQDVILDGEIVAWGYLSAGSEESGRALPFSALQQRLGRKRVSEEMIRRVPVAYLAFDILYADGELLLDRALGERGKILDGVLGKVKSVNHRGHEGSLRKSKPGSQSLLTFDPSDERSQTRIIRAPVFRAASAQELDTLFEAAQARSNEGLMIKDPESPYTPGRRGKSWLKLKRELATLDVVVTAVEYGHGKRISVLSDYTFAVRDGERLVNIGKAYSGLTDVKIAEMTKWFLEHTLEDQGLRLVVEPKIVLEVAFNNMMKSERHNSGYALRFPRIVRLRPDKLPEEADTIERVKEIYEKQNR
ncbi:MAG: ATP-dependent DNA ligase [Terriglobales bacterium]|jgi:DNA ligase-1|nr:ATP-dependent DNA ligase [Terriglobales bacterium]